MLPKNINDIVLPVVQKFVADLNGFYRAHCSDKLLTAVIISRLSRRTRHDSMKTVAEAIIDGDNSGAYDSVCLIFETILEHECRAGGNGHHVAQSFAAAMEGVKAKPEKKQLLPCPFCSDKSPRLVAPNDNYVWCTNALCAIYDIEISVDKWNKRAI